MQEVIWWGRWDSNPEMTLVLNEPHRPFCYSPKMVKAVGLEPT